MFSLLTGLDDSKPPQKQESDQLKQIYRHSMDNEDERITVSIRSLEFLINLCRSCSNIADIALIVPLENDPFYYFEKAAEELEKSFRESARKTQIQRVNITLLSRQLFHFDLELRQCKNCQCYVTSALTLLDDIPINQKLEALNP